MSQQFGLGRGLSSLIPNKQPDPQPTEAPVLSQQSDDELPQPKITKTDESIRGDKFVIDIDVSQIVVNPHQPRFQFDEEKLQNLAELAVDMSLLLASVAFKPQN